MRWPRTGLVLLLVSVVVRAAYFASLGGTAIPDLALAFTASEMHAHWEWAGTIAGGDLLGRSLPHPVAAWMRQCGAPEASSPFLGGPAVFPQAPLYPYVLALLRSVIGSVHLVVLAQLLLGSLRVLVVWRLATRAYGETAGLWAGVLAALYGPLLFHEGAVLREWLPALLEPCVLLLLLAAAERGRGRLWAAAGVALAVAALARETALLLAPLAVAWAAFESRPPGRAVAMAPLALALGIGAGLGPLAARNLATGAPVLAISNHVAQSFVEGNAADSKGDGCRILARSQGRLDQVALLTLDTWNGNPAGWLRLQARKLRVALEPSEVPGSLSYAYGLGASPVLRVLPRFGLLLPLAVAGLLVGARPEIGAPARRLLALFAVTAALAVPLGPVTALDRLATVPLLCVLAGAALARVHEALDDEPWRPALGTALVAALVAALQQGPLRLPELTAQPPRTDEGMQAAAIFAAQGRVQDAVDEIAALQQRIGQAGLSPPVELSEASGDYRCRLASTLLDAGRVDDAQRQVALAEGEYARVGSPRTLFNLGVLYARLGDAKRAHVYLGQYLQVAQDDPSAARARSALRGLPPG